jgi:hypothetical protein
MKMLFAPPNAGVKLNARFTVNVVPDTVTDDAPASTRHWLFCDVTAAPMANAVSKNPSSLANRIELDERSKKRKHAPAELSVAFTFICVETMLAAPLGSEYVNAKVWAEPLPAFGETDTAEGGADPPLLVTLSAPVVL